MDRVDEACRAEDELAPDTEQSDPGETPDNGEPDGELEAGGTKRRSVKKTASKVAGSVSSVVKQALVARDHVLMVRINDESLARINDLKDAGLFRSRSEAAAYLIAEGIDAKAELFERISDRIRQIQEIKDELRSLAGDPDDAGSASDPEESDEDGKA